jgi:ankyrin repeat protein
MPFVWYQSQHGYTGFPFVALRGFGLLPPENLQGKTALMHAAQMGHDKIVEQLLTRYRANTGLRDKKGRTAYDLAASNGREAVQALLVR